MPLLPHPFVMISPLPQLDIIRWCDTPRPDALLPGIDAIFFETAGTKTFPDASTRMAFRERWLGRYLAHDPNYVWLAVTADGHVAGYLIGSLDDPALTPRFADIAYFPNIAHLTQFYPAHLHVNLGERWRGGGIGSRLIEAFATCMSQAGVPGFHVITGAGMRNVGFYTRNRLVEVARIPWNDRELVMLARPLARSVPTR